MSSRNFQKALREAEAKQKRTSTPIVESMSEEQIREAAFQSRRNREANISQKLTDDSTRGALMKQDGYDWFDIDEISRNPRNDYSINEEEIEELANLIYASKHVQPLVLRETEEGIQIIDGELRWRASKLLAERYGDAWRMVPAQCYPMGFDDDRANLIMDSNNLGGRSRISPSEAARGYARIAEHLDKLRKKDPSLKGVNTKTWLADRFGVSERTAVTNLNIGRNLLREGMDLWDSNKITQAQAEAISRLPEEKQHLVVDYLAGKDLASPDVDKIIEVIRDMEVATEEDLDSAAKTPGRKREMGANDHLKKAKKSIVRAAKCADSQEANLILLAEIKQLVRVLEQRVDTDE